MLDPRALIDDFEHAATMLERRGVSAEILGRLADCTHQRLEAIQTVEGQRSQLNQATRSIQEKAKAGEHGAVATVREELKTLKASIKLEEERLTAVEKDLNELLLDIPNLPHESVPMGEDESSNRLEREWGDKPIFNFEPKAHWDIGEALGMLDFERAVRMSGSRFTVYKGWGARLERALINFMLDMARERGFEEILPPFLVRRDAMVGAGQYPKFEGESFETLDHEYALIPTGEVPLVNLHREEILEEEILPLRYVAHTPCFRREAGAAGRDTRGLVRQHQFNKVELVAITSPAQSYTEHERLTETAEAVLRALSLPYRVMTLSSGDMSFASAKTYDIEVWLPSQKTYREISSCSNTTDFQSRRASIRFRPRNGGGKKKPKPRLVHTLNGSGLAVGRTLVAILENGQQEDGSVRIPERLVPYLGTEQITQTS